MSYVDLFIWCISSLLSSRKFKFCRPQSNHDFLPFQNNQRQHTDNPVHKAPLKAFKTHYPSCDFFPVNSHDFIPMETYSIG